MGSRKAGIAGKRLTKERLELEQAGETSNSQSGLGHDITDVGVEAGEV